MSNLLWGLLLWLFASILFLSAFLLFWVQLLVSKLMLPWLGGSPWVWNTCACFFQAVLLLGYGYASWHPLRQRTVWPLVVHCSLLLLPIYFLPIRLHSIGLPPTTSNPIPWLLSGLAVTVGLPVLAVATTAPLLQQWFAHTAHPDRHDPYFLYAASNFGSFLSLLAYPLVIEPSISLTQQTKLWAGGYGLLVLLIAVAAIAVHHTTPSPPPDTPTTNRDAIASNLIATDLPLPHRQPLRWLGLSVLPASLLLGVTTYIATDLASVPFLWAIPLAIYLLSFVLTFNSQFQLLGTLAAIAPPTITLLLLLVLLQVPLPIWVSVPLHLFGLGLVAVLFHGQLFQTRPPAQHLTQFYLWMAVGGVLGSLVNAIAAPLLFPTVSEYPLALLLSLVLLPVVVPLPIPSSLRLLPTLSFGILIGVLLVGFGAQPLLNYGWAGAVLAVGGAIALGVIFEASRWRLGLIASLVLLLGQFAIATPGKVLATERSFFGVNRVIYEAKTNAYSLLHGTTLHGKQIHYPNGQLEPLTYFHPSGPIGQVFSSLASHRLQRVGVLGLGIGTLVAYAQPSQQWTFYEIDPTVVQLARDRRFFTFLTDAKVKPAVVLGDGRLALQQTADQTYDLLIMDAFSSDAIPVHLVTHEAVQLYLSKLAAGGLLAVNISNRYINLEPVLAALAKEVGLVGLQQRDEQVSVRDRAAGKLPSHWVLLARQQQDFGSLVQDQRWRSLAATTVRPWTDDFSNIVQVLRWR